MSKKQDESQNINVEEFEKLQTEFNNLQTLTTQLEGQLKRAVADYHNLEKRVAEGRSELTRWGTSALLTRILPVLDHLEKVVDFGRPALSERSESKDWFKGVEMAVKELTGVLQSEGLEQIAADGQFDPNMHEALDTREGEDNKILEVVKKGYTLNGKVLRPAGVVVGRKQESSNENQELRKEKETSL
ncbi:MAG: Protein GrpE [Candidatus Daviesbacteria bacterium GW2011_GWB1_39_5]|uniref:Protein GrpE n=1 Tax=Candidatus Daviesbacteria bacterium GW2011_GWC2_40_12 TaxID=1618431 RepID=A0A0G0QPN1_9BACT|nr:MAG: Protein GrpE [Candidatus Daviesbacteria bacterium GW2011_GWA2_39_33]KKR24095.1 MAG: Protein GrpE [Candidatus Daviesbacteria bacterium GW2011_GWB1_39_5]KKR42078.1 MAG: Protein GrpE [Candidatus Daviesbacteria bacterium GW2011_GWC2_40_12]OGE20846.1 MAG: nucleotide exchange factor GrpE [Candidatus Daviesbacteria bacterium RIFCSPHIGHO2_01_FULL_40_24]OGE28198.1 MAG: nucleotide exchange factor GrpE [Candidatus Daviesbacteria bacterium RIFCSPHIGHO2_02_FULL_40_16]OGE41819.1 MAG: nucleotide exch